MIIMELMSKVFLLSLIQTNFDKGELIIYDFGSFQKISFRVTGYI